MASIIFDWIILEFQGQIAHFINVSLAHGGNHYNRTYKDKKKQEKG